MIIGCSLLRNTLISSTWFIMTLIAGCIRMDLQNPWQLQKPHPLNHTLYFITLRYPLNTTLNCFLFFNTIPCGTIGIAIPLQLPAPRMLIIVFLNIMFHKLLVKLTYLGGKGKYMDSVFAHNLWTDKVKKIVCEHQSDKYAHYSHVINSTKSFLD